jgi:hypothetical protein
MSEHAAEKAARCWCGGERGPRVPADADGWGCLENIGHARIAEKDVLADPRVQPDSFVVYPTDYDLIPYSDRESWALTVTNGHTYGWSIRPGIGMSSSVALNRKGERIFESRGSGHNKARRWPLNEALRIALSIVDTHKVGGISAAEAVANRDRIIASFERVTSPEVGRP